MHEVFIDLDDSDIQHLIEQTKTRIKRNKETVNCERRLKHIEISDLQQSLALNKDRRNLKLYATYQRETVKDKEKALLHLTKDLKTQKQKREFSQRRISVINHAEKVRQKVEVNQMVDILKNHKSNSFWEANLR